MFDEREKEREKETDTDTNLYCVTEILKRGSIDIAKNSRIILPFLPFFLCGHGTIRYHVGQLVDQSAVVFIMVFKLFIGVCVSSVGSLSTTCAAVALI